MGDNYIVLALTVTDMVVCLFVSHEVLVYGRHIQGRNDCIKNKNLHTKSMKEKLKNVQEVSVLLASEAGVKKVVARGARWPGVNVHGVTVLILISIFNRYSMTARI